MGQGRKARGKYRRRCRILQKTESVPLEPYRVLVNPYRVHVNPLGKRGFPEIALSCVQKSARLSVGSL